MRPPAFQFYPDDFIGGTADLTPTDVGAYMRLLCFQWGRGSIPTTKDAIDRVAGCSVSDEVLAKFPNGKNIRLEAEREKQAAWREKCRTGGQHSAANKRSSRVVEQPSQGEGQLNGNSPLSTLHSPSPIPLPSPKDIAMSAFKNRIGKWFSRRETTQWTVKEEKAAKSVLELNTHEDDFGALEVYYTSLIPVKDDYRRREIETLLNNWNGEIDKAKKFRPLRRESKI